MPDALWFLVLLLVPYALGFLLFPPQWYQRIERVEQRFWRALGIR